VSALVALLLVAGGFSLIIVADRQGWLGGAAQQEQGCPHGLDAEDCPFCNESLIAELGMCAAHGVPEALCTRCNPAIIPAFQTTGDWCAPHNVPESQCTICNPGLLEAEDTGEPTSSTPALAELVERPEVPRNQRSPAVTCQTTDLQVQFLSPEIARDAGLAYARVERREVAHTITANAEIAYDGNRYVQLSSRAPGVVTQIQKDLGEAVAAGTVLAIVDSETLGKAKAEHLEARAAVSLWERNHSREERLLEKHIAVERDVLEAEANLAMSRIRVSKAVQSLRNLGLSDAQIEESGETGDTSSRLPLASPFSGVVVERSAVAGQVVDTTEPLFAVADTDGMWAMLDVYESDVPHVRAGQSVVFEAEGLPGRRHGGRVTWISSHVDRRTRTLKVRAEVGNPNGLLRAGMFGKAIISIREAGPALLVPKEAVQWEGCCNVVFVRKSDVLFEPRKVQLGYEMDGVYVVEAGLTGDEEVVTTGSFLLKTEILKGSIGAGCCEVEPGK
jgi:cobalt-zinc-cadmium efflux system membrane fusion protein